jgi:hypothetical protein
LDLNQSDSSCEEDEVEEFRFIDLSKEKTKEHELNEEKRTLCSIVEQFKNLNFDAKAKYKILCIYDFNINTNDV